jgi:hypothetical protein
MLLLPRFIATINRLVGPSDGLFPREDRIPAGFDALSSRFRALCAGFCSLLRRVHRIRTRYDALCVDFVHFARDSVHSRGECIESASDTMHSVAGSVHFALDSVHSQGECIESGPGMMQSSQIPCTLPQILCSAPKIRRTLCGKRSTGRGILCSPTRIRSSPARIRCLLSWIRCTLCGTPNPGHLYGPLSLTRSRRIKRSRMSDALARCLFQPSAGALRAFTARLDPSEPFLGGRTVKPEIFDELGRRHLLGLLIDIVPNLSHHLDSIKLFTHRLPLLRSLPSRRGKE